MLGVVGDSGAGKSTLSDGVAGLLGAERVTDVCLDDYHAYDRKQRLELGITPLHPACNHLDLMAQHMELLREGRRVFKPVYDHSTGTLGPPEIVAPRAVVIAHGLHGFFTPELRRVWDVSVYLDPDPELRIAWKIQRDTAKRGYMPRQVREELERRRSDSEQFIAPQRERADIVVSFYPPGSYGVTQDNAKLNVRITLRHPIPLPDLEEALVVASGNSNGYVRMTRGTTGADVLEIQGTIPDAVICAIEKRMWDHMSAARHLPANDLGIFSDGPERKRSNSLLVTQLVLTYYLVKASALARKQEELAGVGGGR
ncbi:MAG: phosphoribulokinase [Gemmatimonadetes bacterium]|nr:phosphoribulokinase [Gemmatimonadota bacterium]